MHLFLRIYGKKYLADDAVPHIFERDWHQSIYRINLYVFYSIWNMTGSKRYSRSLLLILLAFTLYNCTEKPIDTALVRQAYYGSHLRPWGFSMDNLPEAHKEQLGRGTARVYNHLRASLGADNALIREINKATPDRDVAMMRVAALQSEKARACLWAYEMHFVATGESPWPSTLSYELIARNLKDLRIKVPDFTALLDMPYNASEKEAFEQKAGELLEEAELSYLQSVAEDYDAYIRPGL